MRSMLLTIMESMMTTVPLVPLLVAILKFVSVLKHYMAPRLLPQ